MHTNKSYYNIKSMVNKKIMSLLAICKEILNIVSNLAAAPVGLGRIPSLIS